MLADLVALGRRLREDGLIPPPGLAYYSEPVRWTLTVRPTPSNNDLFAFALIETTSDRFRPDSGRTSGPVAYPLADLAAYVLGVDKKEDGKKDAAAKKKHDLFLARLDDTSAAVKDRGIKSILSALRRALSDKTIGVPEAVKADHWVVVEAISGALSGQPLFENEEVQEYWVDWLKADVTKTGSTGTCSVLGTEGPLVDRIPGKSYFVGKAAFLGLDKDSFVSLHGGPAVSKKSSIGLSYEAADVANRALEYLSRSKNHRRRLVYDKDSDLRSVTTLFWMDAEEPVVVETGGIATEQEPLALLSAAVATWGENKAAQRADLSLVRDLLKLPWSTKRSALNLDTVGVHFAILSKNAYRVVVRDYRTESLAAVKTNLTAFLDAAALVDPRGVVRAVPVYEMLETAYGIVNEKGELKASATKSVNHARALFRTAYFGTPPPLATLGPALARIRILMTKEDDAQRGFRLHALLSLVKLLLTHRTPDAMTLEHLDPARNERAYLCGRLLAVLGRIQQDALTDDNRKGEGGAVLNRTITERYFASASLAPSAYLGTLVQRATTAHIPKLPDQKPTDSYKKTSRWALDHLQTLSSRIHELGGFPHTLDLTGQGEFALGYYHQRSRFYGGKTKAEGNTQTSPDAAESPDLFTPTADTDA